MVEIEEMYADKYGIWIDGNEPHAGTVRILTRGPRMDQLGITEELRAKHQLLDYRGKNKMRKTELWKQLLAAQVEQELINAGYDAEGFDGFMLKPQAAIEDPAYILLGRGVRPNYERRRVTYAQIVIACPPVQSDVAKNALHSVIDNLYFNLSEPTDYDDYHGFETQCRQFLRYIMEISQDKEAYKRVSRETGIRICRILP